MKKAKARVLILDDEADLRKLLLDFLEDFDEFDVRSACSAEDALAQLSGERAELCIVDVRLPGMNGEEFIQIAKAGGLCDRFLLHTGFMDFTLSHSLSQQGLTPKDIFSKPCAAEELLIRIREILNLPGT